MTTLAHFAEATATATKKSGKPKHLRKKFHEAQAWKRGVPHSEMATVRQVDELQIH